NQVPYRAPGESLVQPAEVLVGTHALDSIIYEINTVENDLPTGPAYKANQYAAKMLLMKCYLNRAVYINRSNPHFENTDMDKVITLADEIIERDTFKLSKNYFDNFAPDNTAAGTENIFTIKNDRSVDPQNLMVLSWLMSLHYDQYAPGFGGVNGFTTLDSFYNKFESNDIRRGTAYKVNGSPVNPGNHVNVGFLVGQQYYLNNPSNPNDSIFTSDKNSVPLNYTSIVSNLETGPGARLSGIRGIKYYPDFQDYGSPDNDFVFFRFSDVLLMKAEAIHRGGSATEAGGYGNNPVKILNSIRTHSSRNASALTAVDNNILLDERGRELWWEGWRRQDMIRFGKFLKPVQERDYESDPKFLLYAIPAEQIAVNPNLKQNPGY
ncbi:MAG: RagB/SusD family nutrient uptake outer membrane protein, partial [Ferruginibacter sp.]